MKTQIEKVFESGNTAELVKAFENVDDVDAVEFITDLIKQNNVSIKDVMDNCNYNNESVLYDIPDYIIEDYYNDNLKVSEPESYRNFTTDNDMLYAISQYCHSRHTLVDYNIVIEDMKDLLERNNYDRRMLPNTYNFDEI